MTVITFLTDFGLQDDFVGTCHGVIARHRSRRARDRRHARHRAAGGAPGRARAAQHDARTCPSACTSPSSIPDVGGDRRAIAVRDARRPHVRRPGQRSADARGGASSASTAAHELTNERYRLPEVSRTFHARDVFAPAAAHLAAGVRDRRARAGGRHRRRSCGSTCRSPGRQVADLGDRARRSTASGTSRRTFARAHLEALGARERRPRRDPARRSTATTPSSPARSPTRAPGELILYEDSYGLVTLAISRGDAARLTGVAPGDEMRIAVT